MALTQQQLDDVAIQLIQRIFVSDGGVAHGDLDNIKAAVQAIETGMNATTTVVESAYSGVVLKSALLQYAQTGAPGLTAQQGGVALAFWALKEVGIT